VNGGGQSDSCRQSICDTVLAHSLWHAVESNVRGASARKIDAPRLVNNSLTLTTHLSFSQLQHKQPIPVIRSVVKLIFQMLDLYHRANRLAFNIISLMLHLLITQIEVSID